MLVNLINLAELVKKYKHAPRVLGRKMHSTRRKMGQLAKIFTGDRPGRAGYAVKFNYPRVFLTVSDGFTYAKLLATLRITAGHASKCLACRTTAAAISLARP